MHYANRFPRPVGRGLIEAISRGRPARRRDYFRDQLIAASLKLANGDPGEAEYFEFPRSIDRGLIEAATTSDPYCHWTNFRDQLIAASLKPVTIPISWKWQYRISAIN